MQLRTLLASAGIAVALATASGCAVTRGRGTVGARADDATVTAAVRARFVEDETVDATAISIATLDGTVMLSGFARSEPDRDKAEDTAMRVEGVASVRNLIAVRP